MATVQGDFTNKAAAEHAKETLTQAGIAEGRIRIWNIIPGSDGGNGGGNAALTGAAVGGFLGGAPGLVAGAGIGTVLSGGYDSGPPLPDPSGVRVVVDTAADAEQIQDLLNSAGAAHVQEGLG